MKFSRLIETHQIILKLFSYETMNVVNFLSIASLFFSSTIATEAKGMILYD